MLLLFWRTTAELTVGTLNHIRWYHTVDYPPRCICGAENGFSVINPFLKTDFGNECSFALTSSKCTASDVYDGQILMGTQSNGVVRLDYTQVNDVGCGNPQTPSDLSSYVTQSLTTSSGLLSDTIVAIEVQGTYIGVLTDAGLSWYNGISSSPVTYATTSGSDVFISANTITYVAEGKSLRSKSGIPTDFLSWDAEWEFSAEINDIWVNSKDNVDTIFVGTKNGAYVIEGAATYDYSTQISGSSDIISVAAELDASYNWGHLFTISSGYVNVFNLKQKELETSITYGDGTMYAIEVPRLYSK